MSEEKFSVHKSVVLSNRKALALYLFTLNRAQDVPSIMSQLVNLDQFKGDRIPLDIVTDDINLAANILQEDYLGLKIVDLIDIELLPLYKGIKQSIEPLLNAGAKLPFLVLCRLVTRYFKVITESVQVHLIEENKCMRLDFYPSNPGKYSHHQIDGAMLGVFRILAAFSSTKLSHLTLSHRQSNYGIELYKQYMKASAEPAQLISSLYYVSDVSCGFQQEADGEEEYRFFIGPLHNLLDKEFPNSSYVERCQHILLTIIGLNEPTREQVAQTLNMSVSSLQRRLREEGVSFQQVLQEMRKTLADKYLIDQKLSATNVAFLLGYQSSSQFFKAFKSWFGMTPMEYQINRSS